MKQYFVIVNDDNGEKLIPLVTFSNTIMYFENEDDAIFAGYSDRLGNTNGFGVFKLLSKKDPEMDADEWESWLERLTNKGGIVLVSNHTTE